MSDRRRYVSYSRQSLSRDPVDSLSIEFQQAACREFIARHGGVLVGEFSDPDTKGWKRHRPGFDAMLDQIRTGNADTVVLYKLSRFARNLVMQEEVVSLIAESGGELVSVTEPHINTSPMVRQILGAVNEQYRRDQGDWLRATFAARARRGHHHGYAPYGYRIEDTCLVLDDATAAQARQLWEWALQGHGTPEVTYRANERGWTTRNGKHWHQMTILRLLRNPTYAGHVQHRGEIVARDAHPALVTDAEFAAVQATIDRRSYHRRKSAPSWAEGFVYHACGRRMYLAGWTDGTYSGTRFRCKGMYPDARHRHERCPVRPSSVMAHKVEAAIIDQVGAIGDRLAPPADVLRALQDAQGSTAKQRDRQRAGLVKRRDDLERQRQRLLDLVLAEKIDADLYRERDDGLKAEIDTVIADLDAVPAPVRPADVTATHAHLLTLAEDARIYAAHDPTSLVAILGALDARLVVGRDGMVLEVGERLRAYVR